MPPASWRGCPSQSRPLPTSDRWADMQATRPFSCRAPNPWCLVPATDHRRPAYLPCRFVSTTCPPTCVAPTDMSKSLDPTYYTQGVGGPAARQAWEGAFGNLWGVLCNESLARRWLAVMGRGSQNDARHGRRQRRTGHAVCGCGGGRVCHLQVQCVRTGAGTRAGADAMRAVERGGKAGGDRGKCDAELMKEARVFKGANADGQGPASAALARRPPRVRRAQEACARRPPMVARATQNGLRSCPTTRLKPPRSWASGAAALPPHRCCLFAAAEAAAAFLACWAAYSCA